MLDYQCYKFKDWLYCQFEKDKGKPISERFNMKRAIEMLGVSKTNVYQYFRSKSLERNTVKKIVTTFRVSENAIWGDQQQEVYPQPEKFLSPYAIDDPAANMWIIPIKAKGGFLCGFTDSNYLKMILTKVSFPFIVGECFVFEIEGESMLNEYVPRKYFIASHIDNPNFLVKGRPYVFQTHDSIIIKCFESIDEQYVYIYALNDEYNPIAPILIKDIVKIYQKEGYLEL